MELVEEELEVLVPVAVEVGKPGPRSEHPGLASRIFKQVFVLLIAAALAYGCFQLSQRYVVQVVQVSGVSMSPTLPVANWYLLNRFIYRFREPRSGDIVVLRDPQDQGHAIKRIVAKPGDAVYFKGGQVYVNGELLIERYLSPDVQTFSGPADAAQLWVCEADHYFVLGDNRDNSTDSRIYGTVPRQFILGMVMQ
jgi:signal peptidase I